MAGGSALEVDMRSGILVLILVFCVGCNAWQVDPICVEPPFNGTLYLDGPEALATQAINTFDVKPIFGDRELLFSFKLLSVEHEAGILKFSGVGCRNRWVNNLRMQNTKYTKEFIAGLAINGRVDLVCSWSLWCRPWTP
jgi:hypothetical protein